MTGLMQDLRYAIRGLRKSPGFAAVSLLTLALCIGANTAMFSVLNAALLRPLPYRAPEELVMLWTEAPTQGVREGRSAYGEVDEWRSQSTTFADMAVFDPVSVTLTDRDEQQQTSALSASPNLFAVFGVQPSQGRSFTAEEAERRERVVLISHRFWQSRFGGAADALGKTVALDGRQSQVIGIMPSGFNVGTDLWQPHTLSPDWTVRGGGGAWFVLGRLRPGVTIQQAQQEMSVIAARLGEGRAVAERGRGISVMPLSHHVVGRQSRLTLWMLTGAVFCVLLIGVTNITNLSLARNARREREMAVRTALGASRARLFRQLLAESATLAVLSGCAGLLFAVVGIDLIMSMRPGNLSFLNDVGIDASVLGWTSGIAVVSGILIGLIPAMTAGTGVAAALREGRKGASAGTATPVVRRALVVAEFALAIVLLIGTGLLVRSLREVEKVDPGFKPEQVLSVQLSTVPTYQTDTQRIDYYSRVLEKVEAAGGVERAGIIGDLFIGGSPEQLISAEGAARVSDRFRLRRDEVSPGFFETLRIPIVKGRSISDDDGPTSLRVAVINAVMADRLWPGQDAVGRRFKLGAPESAGDWYTVVGVAGNMRRQGLENEPIAQMFEPLPQNPSRLSTLFVRTSTEPSALADTVRSAIRQVDKQTPIYGMTTLVDRLGTFQAERRFQTTLLTAFSVVALLLAVIGIYGVSQFSVATRTHEIGVRVAVGAQRGDIFRMIVGEGLQLSLIGLGVGLLGAWLWGRIGSSLLFGVTATDPMTYVLASCLLTFVAVLSCYLPARRAAGIDPLVALRHE